MSRTVNALNRGELQRGLKLVTKDVEKLTRDISGADSEPVKKAALVLRAEWRRLLNVPGSGKPAAPGSPPHRQKGILRRSVKTAIVQGVRRVGTANFRMPIHEYGTDKEPPHPSARPALENVAGKMGDVIVQESQRAVVKAP